MRLKVMTNEKFVKTFRLEKAHVLELIEDLTPLLPQQLRSDGLSTTIKILIALGFYASGSYQNKVGQYNFHCVTQGSVSRAVHQTMLEVCIDSLESAINAVLGGADELEVCSSLTEGGLTPSPGLVTQVMEMVNNIAAGKPIRKSCRESGCDKLTKKPRVNVMIRCRTGSDFHYSQEEIDTMLSDVDVFKQFGVDRFVFGALTEIQNVDEINCERLIAKASPAPVTFHRAFDVCINPLAAIKKITELGFNRLLTSGQKSSANDAEAVQLIKSLITSFGDKIEIMPGAGINLDNARNFIDMGCKIVHSSCKRIRYLPQIKNSLSMGTSDSEHIYITDENIVRKMKAIINYRMK